MSLKNYTNIILSKMAVIYGENKGAHWEQIYQTKNLEQVSFAKDFLPLRSVYRRSFDTFNTL